MYSRVNPAKASVMAKGQLFQAHLYLEAAMPGRATSMPPALLRACREVMMSAAHPSKARTCPIELHQGTVG